MSVSTVFIILLIVTGLYFIAVYNGLVTLKNRVKNAYSQIDVQLRRRYDLIPNLVETAKAYLRHERETLEAVVAARNTAVEAARGVDPARPETLRPLMRAESGLAESLGRFNLLVENYPDLKAAGNLAQLHEELISTENRVAFARQGYNDAVMLFNTRRESFPDNLIAEHFGFREAALWELDAPEARQAVRVAFS